MLLGSPVAPEFCTGLETLKRVGGWTKFRLRQKEAPMSPLGESKASQRQWFLASVPECEERKNFCIECLENSKYGYNQPQYD